MHVYDRKCICNFLGENNVYNIEVGLSSGIKAEVNIGNTILFKKEPHLLEGVVAKVVDIKYYNSFLEMAKVMSIKAMGFDGLNASQVAEKLVQKYSAEKEKESGVVAIKFELLI